LLDLPNDTTAGSGIFSINYSNYINAFSEHNVRLVMLKGQEFNIDDVHLFSVGINDRKKYKNYLNALEDDIARNIISCNPDVIHCHHLCFGISEVLNRANLDIKRISFCHGTDVIFAKRNAHHKKTLIESISKSEVVIVPTEEMLIELKSICGDKSVNNARVVYWGVNVNKDLSARNDLSLRNGVLFVGRNSPEKGVDNLIKLIYANPLLNFTIVTDERISLDLNKARNVTQIIGHLPQSKVIKLMRIHKYLLVPTTGIEAFSLVCAEAMSMKLPVISYKSSSIKEVLPSSFPSLRNSNTYLSKIYFSNYSTYLELCY
ncbi:glycosyltransferase family 4 protein, partial [Vibrio hyugaensis]|uniref:glycosyltransferase family 4 protein n=1 Tax=Vibrio hyugaensis TaxID=1534743 RepID=UPI0011B00BFA